LPDLDELTYTNHPHIAIMFIKSFAKYLKKDKEVELEYDCAKVRAKAEAEQITKVVKFIRADMAQINSAARIPTRDPRDITVVDEEWFEFRRHPNK
jgi:hypothetical protein